MSSRKPTQEENTLTIVAAMAAEIHGIRAELNAISKSLAPAAPNFSASLAQYQHYEWDDIGAQVVSNDKQGAAAVVWNGHRFSRRSGAGTYGKAIWYSRAIGHDAEGKTKYGRLITFKEWDQVKGLHADLEYLGTTFSPLTDPDRDDIEKRRQDREAIEDAAEEAGEEAPSPGLVYANGQDVPDNERTREIFEIYERQYKQRPRDGAMLQAWWQKQTGKDKIRINGDEDHEPLNL